MHNFIVPGDANMRRWSCGSGASSVRGVSAALSYEITQAENPNLTILSSANPVNYGLAGDDQRRGQRRGRQER